MVLSRIIGPKIGFGVEIEVSVKPYKNERWDAARHFENFANTLASEHGLEAVRNRTNQKYPSKYDKWFITGDSSIASSPGFSMYTLLLELLVPEYLLTQLVVGMECVSPIIRSSKRWERVIKKVWNTLREMFEIERSLSCGSHIHLAPWRKKYTLQEAKRIAFACCYYERYIIACLPEERRDHLYCRRNSMVATKMGKLYRAKTTNSLAHIASDINALHNFEELIVYIQGGTALDQRRVLWNFHNLWAGSKGTIEFRGGRHLRGPQRAIAWITFAQVFILMALKEVRS